MRSAVGGRGWSPENSIQDRKEKKRDGALLPEFRTNRDARRHHLQDIDRRRCVGPRAHGNFTTSRKNKQPHFPKKEVVQDRYQI